MERKQIIANVSVVSVGVIFLVIMMWYLPDMALNLLFICGVSVSVSTIVVWRARVDQRKDERTIQLMTLAGRNAFMFLVFAMPMLGGFIVAGIISLDAAGALWLLWSIALGIALISFFYYYTR